jgi:glycosyltransferase involved in cell wall biosynthesis
VIQKRIIHLITTIEFGGAEKQLLILTKNQIEQGFEVEVFYLKGRPELKPNFEEAGIKVNSLLANKRFMHQVLLFKKFIGKNQAPVHTHLPQAELVAALTCKKNRFIISRHNFEPFWPNKPRVISRALSRFVTSRAAGGIAISNAIKNYLLEKHEVNNRFKLQVVHYGFDYPESNALGSIDLIHEELKSKTNYKIGTIGRIVPGKNYTTMLKAVAQVVKFHPTTKFFIVGGGSAEHDLRNFCKDLGIENNVVWLGRTEHVREFLTSLDLFIFASKGEGFGLVLLEAMQANVPILAANNSAIPEVLGTTYKGLFPTENDTFLATKIMELISDPKKSESLIIDYKKQIQLFDPKVMADKVLKVYTDAGF